MDARLRLAKTGPDILVSNLRGELGEALTAWVLLRHFMASAKKLQTDDIEKDIKNPDRRRNG
jgi:hypothetical protein